MKPERKEEIKRMMEEEYARPDEPYSGRFIANAPQAIAELLATLEETENKLTEREWMLKETLDTATRLEGRLAEAQQTIARQQAKIDAALSWTWNCGEANMLEVIAALKGEQL